MARIAADLNCILVEGVFGLRGARRVKLMWREKDEIWKAEIGRIYTGALCVGRGHLGHSCCCGLGSVRRAVVERLCPVSGRGLRRMKSGIREHCGSAPC